ncbi:MAG: hypothetical protein K6C05_08520 [Anaerovibrio sp.]|uniref:DUF1281 family ferredoxin-like fold protein n=1 Tax=Anaerovibrio sp. TaxID=1872532 RepID=UPI0025E79FF5|nr:hypothetical protein [Anaerovibrio sp.]MCR5176880.1 hypothetical protein [Anaerovibrio sp.]
MANYVRNVLVLLGAKEDVEKVMGFISGKNGLVDMEKILPLPKKSEVDVHHWKIANWGSTDALDCIRNNDNTISFSTAWTAPLKAIETLVKRFPEVDFRYYWATDDRGADSGLQLWEDGEMIKEVRPYNLVYRYCWDSLPLIA